jgi:arylsulfatase A-like enzyme
MMNHEGHEEHEGMQQPSVAKFARAFLFIFALLASFVVPSLRAAERPNILFIMTDDHAAHAMSCYGSKVNETPNLDRLAKEGVCFDRAFVTNSICTPSRATILTGKYSHLNGTPVFNRFDGSQQTVSKLLQAAGYYTGMIGKWHLGSDPTGFDKWIVLPGQGVYDNPAFLTPEGRKVIKGYATEIITDLGLEFLEQRPKDKPFFLMLHHKAPHRPWDPDAKNKAKFAGKSFPEPETLFDDYATRTDALRENKQTIARDLNNRDLKIELPVSSLTAIAQWNKTVPMELDVEGQKLTGDAFVRWKYQRYMQDYLACVQGVDDQVGRVLDYLDRTGLAKNTVVIYTSDNGFFLGDHGLFDKRFMYEPSLRVPLLVRWPAVTKPGTVSDRIVLNNDYAETFLDMAGAPIPADMQGRSLAPLLRGESPSDWRTAFYYRYYHDPGDHNTRAHYGLRTATHKLIYFWKKDQWECFDLANDPNELHNLADDPASVELVARLKAELLRAKKEAKDDDQFADKQPPNGVDGQAAKKEK